MLKGIDSRLNAEFSEMARRSYAAIQTGERRFYGCFMFRKGVIPRDA